jgi:ABC-2 type transport system permease protein
MASRILRLIIRECRLFFTDGRLLLVSLLVPVLYTLLLGSIYLPKRVTQLPTWVIDQDHSTLSRSIRDAVAQHEYFHLVRDDGTPEEFRAAAQRQQAFVCVWIPPHFAEDVKWGRPARLLTLINGDNMLIANSATRGATEIASTYAVGVQMKRLSMRGTPSEYALQAAQPIESATRTWFNPTYNYMDFLLPGVLAAIIQQVALLGIALAFTKERETGAFAQVLSISDSPLEVLLAKSLTYIGINFAGGLAVFLLAIKCFGLQVVGSIGLLAAAYAVFIIGLVALGMLISVATRTQLFATQLLMLIAVPSFLLSGYTWPQIAMTPPILALSNLLPLTHFVLPLREIMMDGADFAVIAPHLRWLWVFAALCYAAAYLTLRAVMARTHRTLPVEL